MAVNLKISHPLERKDMSFLMKGWEILEKEELNNMRIANKECGKLTAVYR